MKKILIVILVIFAVGCAKKYVKAPEGAVKTKRAVAGKFEREVIKKRVSPKEIKETAISVAEVSLFEDTLFDFDKYDIRIDAIPVLNSVASWLNKNKGVNILIEGHCDDRGTNEYNLALGEKRAKATKDYIISRGVASTRIDTVSYGEEKPFCTEQSEGCWQSNRRAHFVIAK